MFYPNKWVLCPKGGDYRKWYGNIDIVLNWENNGEELKAFKRAILGNEKYFFKKGLTWTVISSNKTGFRIVPDGTICDHKGPLIYFFNEEKLEYIMALLNSIVNEKILVVTSPTIGFEWGKLAATPFIETTNIDIKKYINSCVEVNIKLSKQDWDSFETSWDFERHPLI